MMVIILLIYPYSIYLKILTIFGAKKMKLLIKKKRLFLLFISGALFVYFFCLHNKQFNVPYSTVVKDRTGELLGARIASDEQWRFPPCDTVPRKFKICLIQFEDRYFRYHWGINPLATGRALLQNIRERKIVSGGSTITMQLIRLSRNKKRTVLEKCYEAILATRLEFRFSKDKILAIYASHAPFGGNVIGLDAAAWRYFGHSANQLSWAESATLAVLPNAPSTLHPAKNRDLLLVKRNRLLKRLLDKNLIDYSSYELALSEDLPGEPLPLPQIAPHWVNLMYQTHNGKQIITTIDKNLQKRIEDLLELRQFEFSQLDIRNLAAIVVDVKSKDIIAYCGNVRFNEKGSGNQVDIIRADRSTGSILKPFLYYAALHEGIILPNTLLPDIPLNVNGFSPQNFNRRFEGAVSASEAVTRSLNVPLVNLLRQYGVPNFYNFIKKHHITSLPETAAHYGLSLILGGAEAQLGNLVKAYTDMARSLLNLSSSFEPAAVWHVFDALKEVNRPEEIDWSTISSMQTIAWKTGTSYGFRDAWAIGITPLFVVGVWAGNSSGEGKPNLTGSRIAGPVLFDIFELLPASRWFERPTGVFEEVELCRLSGHLKGRFCEDVDTVLICQNGLQTNICPYHISINVTQDKRFRVFENCAENIATMQESWFVLPPAWSWYYKQKHPEYKSLPPLLPRCGEDGLNMMQFIYPQENAIVYPQKQLDGSIGKITFELAHSNRDAIVFWHIDNEYVTSTADFHKLSVNLSNGVHTVTVVDGEGNTLSCKIQCEYPIR